MRAAIKNTIRSFANVFGVDFVRLHQAPQHSLLGLRGKNIRSIIDCGANEGAICTFHDEDFSRGKVLLL